MLREKPINNLFNYNLWTKSYHRSFIKEWALITTESNSDSRERLRLSQQWHNVLHNKYNLCKISETYLTNHCKWIMYLGIHDTIIQHVHSKFKMMPLSEIRVRMKFVSVLITAHRPLQSTGHYSAQAITVHKPLQCTGHYSAPPLESSAPWVAAPAVSWSGILKSHVRGWLSAASLVICSPHCSVQYVELRGYCPV